MHKFDTAIANLVKNLSLDEAKEEALLLLAKEKRDRANKRWIRWILLFVLIIVCTVVSLYLFNLTPDAFKVVGAGFSVIGALMAFLNEKESMNNEEISEVIGKHLAKVDLDYLNANLGDSFSSSSWMKLLSSFTTFVGIILITW